MKTVTAHHTETEGVMSIILSQVFSMSERICRLSDKLPGITVKM